ncbi:unnamed protein product (mitochondrion) [Plasmodiophora brassicae]|uniref:Uncharacterized protein n=1 Tax=Plasmodiophora brassicae TaxID=37360 RepID=A0A3P3Y4H0_PLABS|nr:unnamed protein product [Plasmodiophora brassicae]
MGPSRIVVLTVALAIIANGVSASKNLDQISSDDGARNGGPSDESVSVASESVSASTRSTNAGSSRASSNLQRKVPASSKSQSAGSGGEPAASGVSSDGNKQVVAQSSSLEGLKKDDIKKLFGGGKSKPKRKSAVSAGKRQRQASGAPASSGAKKKAAPSKPVDRDHSASTARQMFEGLTGGMFGMGRRHTGPDAILDDGDDDASAGGGGAMPGFGFGF